ncbi:phage gp6-like head-tail connector protein [Cereibacter sphaeroides]|nr:phage gp6-like head-tail connector protein [Cereibacter sphaeroides]
MSQIPVLVTPPTVPVVTVDEAKVHLNVTHHDDDAEIADCISAATAHLDGPGGVLGRAIMPQIWRESFTGPGPYRLSLPDVSGVTASAGGAVTVVNMALGPEVTLADEVDAVTITYSAALPQHDLPRARRAILLFVDHLYDRTELSPVYYSLVSALRRRVL